MYYPDNKYNDTVHDDYSVVFIEHTPNYNNNEMRDLNNKHNSTQQKKRASNIFVGFSTMSVPFSTQTENKNKNHTESGLNWIQLKTNDDDDNNNNTKCGKPLNENCFIEFYYSGEREWEPLSWLSCNQIWVFVLCTSN